MLTKEQLPIALTAIHQNQLAISGSLAAFLFHDTYAFDLTLSPADNERDVAAAEIDLFEPSSLFLECSENTLGETIWLYGQTEIIEKPWDFPSPQHPLLPPHPFIIALVLSCLGGGGLGWLAWFFTKRHLNAKSSPQQTSLPSPQNQLPSGDV